MSEVWFRVLAAALAAWMGAISPPASRPDGFARQAPQSEILSYNIEWRFIHAGNARFTWGSSDGAAKSGWAAQLHLEAAGLVSRLYKVDDEYSSLMSDRFCIASSQLKASEGNRHHETRVTFDSRRRKAISTDHDLVKNVTLSDEVDIQPCEHDVFGALYELRALRLEPGRSVEIPVSDGKKAVMAKVEAQEREIIKTDFGTYKTIRYEAFLFNNVLYRRHGRLFVWLTDDDRRLPVQIRVRMPVYVGTVTLQLEKEGKS